MTELTVSISLINNLSIKLKVFDYFICSVFNIDKYVYVGEIKKYIPCKNTSKGFVLILSKNFV